MSDAMTAEPVTIAPGDSPERARTLMHLGRIRHLPVVEAGVLVGLVSQREVLYSKAAQIRDVMVKEPLVTVPGHPLRKAARVMYQQKIGCLPVVSADRRVLGIITESDFVRFAADMTTELDRVEAIAHEVTR